MFLCSNGAYYQHESWMANKACTFDLVNFFNSAKIKHPPIYLVQLTIDQFTFPLLGKSLSQRWLAHTGFAKDDEARGFGVQKPKLRLKIKRHLIYNILIYNVMCVCDCEWVCMCDTVRLMRWETDRQTDRQTETIWACCLQLRLNQS